VYRPNVIREHPRNRSSPEKRDNGVSRANHNVLLKKAIGIEHKEKKKAPDKIRIEEGGRYTNTGSTGGKKTVVLCLKKKVITRTRGGLIDSGGRIESGRGGGKKKANKPAPGRDQVGGVRGKTRTKTRTKKKQASQDLTTGDRPKTVR